MRYFWKMLASGAWTGGWMLAAVPAVLAAEILVGPIPATLTRVIDGDTVEVRARIWLGQDVEVAVRLAGIDAPELRAQCAQERVQAEAAAAYLRPLEGSQVSLTNVMRDKFGGRILAEVSHANMGVLAVSLMQSGLARPYSGGRRGGWCSTLAATE